MHRHEYFSALRSHSYRLELVQQCSHDDQVDALSAAPMTHHLQYKVLLIHWSQIKILLVDRIHQFVFESVDGVPTIFRNRPNLPIVSLNSSAMTGLTI